MPILDLLGPDYMLIQFNPDVDRREFLVASERANLPITVVVAERPEGDVFRHDLLIGRFDQQVARRGNTVPPDLAVIDVLRGRGPESVHQ